jgi:hypothetical protein
MGYGKSVGLKQSVFFFLFPFFPFPPPFPLLSAAVGFLPCLALPSLGSTVFGDGLVLLGIFPPVCVIPKTPAASWRTGIIIVWGIEWREREKKERGLPGGGENDTLRLVSEQRSGQLIVSRTERKKGFYGGSRRTNHIAQKLFFFFSFLFFFFFHFFALRFSLAKIYHFKPAG